MPVKSETEAGESTLEWRRRAVERVIVSMSQRLDDPLNLDEMAEIAHLSRFHFNRVFGEITGVSPRKFLATLRIDRAKRLLLTTDLSITEVCFEIGCNSLGTFTTHFTTLVGVSPSAWRRLPVDLNLSIDTVTSLIGSARARNASSDGTITGHAGMPEGFQGLVFVGLFQTQIPQSVPIAGDLLFGNNNYQIPSVPDGKYYVLAVALPWPLDLLDFFIPDTMLRDRSGALVISGGSVTGNADLNLREPHLTDPPILIALPFLFAEYLKISGVGPL